MQNLQCEQKRYVNRVRRKRKIPQIANKWLCQQLLLKKLQHLQWLIVSVLRMTVNASQKMLEISLVMINSVSRVNHVSRVRVEKLVSNVLKGLVVKVVGIKRAVNVMIDLVRKSMAISHVSRSIKLAQ